MKFDLYMNGEFRYSFFSRVCAEREKRHLELYAEATGWPHPKLEIKEVEETS